MAVLATDDFNRANNAGGLGTGWTSCSGASGHMGINTNSAGNQTNGTSIDQFTGTAAPANQYSKCTLLALQATSDEGPGPSVRGSTAALTAYFAQCNTTEIKLYKVSAGTFTQLGSNAAAAAVNDIIEIDANGTSITVKKNGTTIIGPITDSSLSTGNWGLWTGGGSANNVFRVDDWEGGDFTGSSVYTKGNFLAFME